MHVIIFKHGSIYYKGSYLGLRDSLRIPSWYIRTGTDNISTHAITDAEAVYNMMLNFFLANILCAGLCGVLSLTLSLGTSNNTSLPVYSIPWRCRRLDRLLIGSLQKLSHGGLYPVIEVLILSIYLGGVLNLFNSVTYLLYLTAVILKVFLLIHSYYPCLHLMIKGIVKVTFFYSIILVMTTIFR